MFPLHPLPYLKCHTADNAREKAQCLNIVFASKYFIPNPLLSVDTLPTHTQLFLDSMSFTHKEESLLSNLDSDSATGPEAMSPRVLKTCSAALAAVESHLALCVRLNLSFSQGQLPSAWKSANINALHKKVAKTDPCNYRPISLLVIINKVMESIIASDIKSILLSNGLISDHKFGFRPGHSTLYMLLLLSKQWMEVLNVKHEIRAISLDIL